MAALASHPGTNQSSAVGLGPGNSRGAGQFGVFGTDIQVAGLSAGPRWGGDQRVRIIASKCRPPGCAVPSMIIS